MKKSAITKFLRHRDLPGELMRRLPFYAAGSRAMMIGELNAQIERAQAMAWQLGATSGDRTEANLLYGRLEAIRLELAAFRFEPAEASETPALAWFRGRADSKDPSVSDQSSTITPLMKS